MYAPPPALAPIALVLTFAEAGALIAITSSKEKNKLNLSVGAIAGIATGLFVVVVLTLVQLAEHFCKSILVVHLHVGAGW